MQNAENTKSLMMKSWSVKSFQKETGINTITNLAEWLEDEFDGRQAVFGAKRSDCGYWKYPDDFSDEVAGYFMSEFDMEIGKVYKFKFSEMQIKYANFLKKFLPEFEELVWRI